MGKQNFWFQLFYRLNGNDLKDATILPLFEKTETPEGQFNIEFEGAYYEPDDPATIVKFAPVAKVKFSFKGDWKPHGSSTPYSFHGYVEVWANGYVGIRVTYSEKDMVSFDYLSVDRTRCPLIRHTPPVVPKAPVRKFYCFLVLFPFGSNIVSPNYYKQMHDWVESWPDTTRDKIARGKVMLNIEGYASPPGGGVFNLNLSGARAQNVLNFLMKFFKSTDIKTVTRPHGEWKQNWRCLGLYQRLKSLLSDRNKYDQAALIWFEDVE
jgi:hypothetical protein